MNSTSNVEEPKKPTKISLVELPDQFERDEKLADFLGMRKTEKI